MPSRNVIDASGQTDPDTPPMLRVTTTHAETRRFYNRVSRFYDLLTAPERRLVDRGIEVLSPQAGDRLLEIGVGTGRGFVELAKQVGEYGKVCGLDISERMLDETRQRLCRAGLSSRTILDRGDALQLPYGDAQFNGIFMSFTLELFDSPEIPQVLSECRRVLETGGRLIVVGLSKPARSSWPVRCYEWGHRAFPQLLDCRPIPVATLVAKAGFEIQTTELATLAGLPVEIVKARRS